jgi:hypothetical protein
MAAEFVDALLGYSYFLEKRGKANIQEINNYLLHEQRKPIHERTYSHYKKLIENGFRTYLPINKFDVFQSLGKLQIAADRRRFDREQRIDPVKISRDGLEWWDGSLRDISLVGLGITTARFPVRPGTQIWVRYTGYMDIPVIVVWRKHEGLFTTMGVRALEYIGKYHLKDTELVSDRPIGYLKITREVKGYIRWDNLFRVFGKSNELIIATSDLIYSVADQINSDIRLTTPVLEKIQFGSPGGFTLKIDAGVSDIIDKLLNVLKFFTAGKREYLAEIRKKELENDSLELDVRQKAIDVYHHNRQSEQNIEKNEVDIFNAKIDLLRNAYKLKNEALESVVTESLIADVQTSLKAILGVNQLPPGSFEQDTPERSILEKRVIPAGAELSGGDDPDFNINTSSIKPDSKETEIQ